jgi:hypothetical protein
MCEFDYLQRRLPFNMFHSASTDPSEFMILATFRYQHLVHWSTRIINPALLDLIIVVPLLGHAFRQGLDICSGLRHLNVI